MVDLEAKRTKLLSASLQQSRLAAKVQAVATTEVNEPQNSTGVMQVGVALSGGVWRQG